MELDYLQKAHSISGELLGLVQQDFYRLEMAVKRRDHLQSERLARLRSLWSSDLSEHTALEIT